MNGKMLAALVVATASLMAVPMATADHDPSVECPASGDYTTLSGSGPYTKEGESIAQAQMKHYRIASIADDGPWLVLLNDGDDTPPAISVEAFVRDTITGKCVAVGSNAFQAPLSGAEVFLTLTGGAAVGDFDIAVQQP